MVSTGENFIGSQFFFTLGADIVSLDGIHCVIGEVVEGHEVLRELNEAIVDGKYRPFKDIRITHTAILEDPYADPRGFKEPSRSPSPSIERLKNGRIAADEDIDDTEGKTDAEIHEMLQDREAKARATILEIVGDIPDADVAPPENVLFVCKLNPVTTDDDLQIIFSRFGRIKTCEVIRDKVSGDSLQYAFIEFEEQKSCEDAYFKMDNVLIDDRRIHVDFSQSVSKIKWRGKGNYTIHDDSDNFKSEKFANRNRNNRNQQANRRSRSPRRNREEDRARVEKPKYVEGNFRNNPRRFNDRRDDDRNFNSRRRSPPRQRRSSPVARRNSRSPRRKSPILRRRSRSPKRRSRSSRKRSPSPRPQIQRNRYPPARHSRSRDRINKGQEDSLDRHEKSSKSHKKSRSDSSSSCSPVSSHKKSKKQSSHKHKHETKSKKREVSSSSDSSDGHRRKHRK